MYKLDKKDLHLLFELDRDSRQSIHDLATKTRLSRDVVAYRIKQLEKNEIIKSYITLIDFTKFGYQIVRLYLKLQNTTIEIEEEMISWLLKQKNIITIYRIDGNYDLAVGFLVKDFHDYQFTYSAFLQKYRRFITEKDFTIFTDFLHFNRNYLVDKKFQNYTQVSTGSFVPSSVDETDLALLKEISVNSRASLSELAPKLNLTAAGVKYKLKQMEKEKIIVAYKLLLDYQKLGYQYYKIDIDVEDLNVLTGLQHFITHHPNVIYQDVTVGGRDFEFDCELKSQEDFYKLINEIRSLFPQKIRSYFYYKALKIYKYSYFPEIP